MSSISEMFVWLIVISMPVTPSFSRWTTLGPCCAWFATAILCHQVFLNAWKLAFAGEKLVLEEGDADDAGLDDFSKILGRRMTKVKALLDNHNHLRRSVIIALATEPIDDLVLRLLHMDVEDNLLMDVVSTFASPICRAQKCLLSFLRSNMPDMLACSAAKQCHRLILLLDEVPCIQQGLRHKLALAARPEATRPPCPPSRPSSSAQSCPAPPGLPTWYPRSIPQAL